MGWGEGWQGRVGSMWGAAALLAVFVVLASTAATTQQRRQIHVAAMFWPTPPSEGPFNQQIHIRYYSTNATAAGRTSGGRWAAALGLSVHAEALVNLYNNGSEAGCACGPALGHSPFPIIGCESAKTPAQYAADRAAVVPTALVGDPSIPQSDFITADLEGLNGLPNRIFSELHLHGKRPTDVFSNSGNAATGPSTPLPSRLRWNGSYGIYDQQFRADRGRFLDPSTITFAEVLATINSTWVSALRRFAAVSEQRHGIPLPWVGEYQTYAANVGLTSNADFNSLDSRLWQYLQGKSTTIAGSFRKHACFGAMADDGMLQHFAGTQVSTAACERPPSRWAASS